MWYEVHVNWFVINLFVCRGAKWPEGSGQTSGGEEHQIYAGTPRTGRGMCHTFQLHSSILLDHEKKQFVFKVCLF